MLPSVLRETPGVSTRPATIVPGPSRRRHRVRGFLVLAVLAFALGGAAIWYVTERSRAPPLPLSQQTGLPPVPVAAVEVMRRDFPIYVRGIGAVQAFNLVTVKSRVDGELQQVLFREGQDVRAGDVLAQIDPRPFDAQLKQAAAAKARDLAQLDTARRDFARSESLVDRGFTTRQTYETQKNLIAQLEAAVLADDAAIDNAKLQLGYARITSPLDGRTGVRLVDAGNMIRTSDSGGIVIIAQLRPISVIFTLPQELLVDVIAAMRAGPLTAHAFTQDNKRRLATGSLTLVDNEIDQATGTMRLKATFANDEETLWPGQFVNVRLNLSTHRDALVVAGPAVQRNQDGTYVWLITPEGSAEVRPVQVKVIQDDEAVVAGGLAEGERVVVAGQSRLRPNAKVIVAKPAVRASLAQSQSPAGATP
jgi:multidrug efflux system membrane fusion protein